jgi:hypothetical protein
MTPEFIVEKLDPFSPTSYCWRCRHLMREGETVHFVQLPIHFRYGKQQKKAKANTSHTHMAHVKCPISASDPSSDRSEDQVARSADVSFSPGVNDTATPR